VRSAAGLPALFATHSAGYEIIGFSHPPPIGLARGASKNRTRPWSLFSIRSISNRQKLHFLAAIVRIGGHIPDGVTPPSARSSSDEIMANCRHTTFDKPF
jgi:hypothetical protein